MKKTILLCRLLALAACASSPAPVPTPGPRNLPPNCDNGGPCKGDEKPR